MSRTTKYNGVFQSVIASVMWGGTGIWIVFLSDLPLPHILLFRFALSLLVVSCIMLVLARPLSATKGDLAGGVALFFYYAFATGAFALANIVSVSLIVSTTPAFVMAAEWAQGRKPAPGEIIGALIAFCGVAVLMAGAPVSGWETGNRELLGEALALGAALAMTAFSLTGRTLDSNAASATFWACLLGSVALLMLAAATPAALSPPSPQQWFHLSGLAAFSTVIAAVCYRNACRLSGATTAAVVRLSTPLFAALFVVVIFGHGLTLRHLLAGVLALLGACLVIVHGDRSDP